MTKGIRSSLVDVLREKEMFMISDHTSPLLLPISWLILNGKLEKTEIILKLLIGLTHRRGNWVMLVRKINSSCTTNNNKCKQNWSLLGLICQWALDVTMIIPLTMPWGISNIIGIWSFQINIQILSTHPSRECSSKKVSQLDKNDCYCIYSIEIFVYAHYEESKIHNGPL